jgi:hypothetical protein
MKKLILTISTIALLAVPLAGCKWDFWNTGQSPYDKPAGNSAG